MEVGIFSGLWSHPDGEGISSERFCAERTSGGSVIIMVLPDSGIVEFT